MTRARDRAGRAGKIPKIVISHRHAHSDLAERLSRLLVLAFDNVTDGDILCTSIHRHSLPPGAPVSEGLRRSISKARVVLGVVTPDARESSYVLFELGAAWGREVTCFPLLARGATVADLPAPIADRHCLLLTDKRACERLVEQLGERAGLRLRTGLDADVKQSISDLSRAARKVAGDALESETWQLTITKPASGESVHGHVIPVEGAFKKRPPSGRYRAFVTSVNQRRVWPQQEIDFDQKTRSWKSHVALLKDPPDYADIVVARCGSEGQRLYDYYTQIGEEEDVWIPVPGFTSDTQVLARVRVKNGRGQAS